MKKEFEPKFSIETDLSNGFLRYPKPSFSKSMLWVNIVFTRERIESEVAIWSWLFKK